MLAPTCIFALVMGLSCEVVRGADYYVDYDDEDKKPEYVFRCEPTNIDDLHVKGIQWKAFVQQHRNFTDQLANPSEKSNTHQTQLLDFQHRSHAGAWEFPYLLDVRTKNSESYKQDSEQWFNANLITSKFAITTCDAIATFRKAEDSVDDKPIYTWEDQGAFPKSLYKNYVLIKKDPNNYKVMYASAYNYKVTKGFEYEVGTRLIESFSPHPKCSFFNVDFSFGIVKLKDPIYPFPPYTNYMHVDFNCTAFQDLKVEYNIPNESNARRLDKYYFDDAACTIGLWGRYIPNVRHINWTTTVVNYKLRYRIRFVDPKECKSSKTPLRFDNFPKEYIECMALAENETLGVICDHDKGAPIVCGEGENEAVRAILLAGATKMNCDNNKPQVFMVLDLRMIYPLFAHINVLTLSNITSGKIIRYSGGGSGGTLSYPNPFWGYCIFTACVQFYLMLSAE